MAAEYIPCSECVLWQDCRDAVIMPSTTDNLVYRSAPDAGPELFAQARRAALRLHQGLEAGVVACAGIKASFMDRADLEFMKHRKSSYIIQAEAERLCGNPFKDAPEYKELRSSLTPSVLRRPQSLGQAQARLESIQQTYESIFAGKRYQRIRRLGRQVTSFFKTSSLELDLSEARADLQRFSADHANE